MSAHIFIDAENVQPEIGFKAVEKFGREYSIERVDIIGKEDSVSNRYLKFNEMYHFQNCYYGKNSADTWLCTEIAKTIFEKPEVEVIILISSDRDFLPAIKLATEQNRKVIVVSNIHGHKNLKGLLWDLKIDPNLVEIVDFQSIRAVTIQRPKQTEIVKDIPAELKKLRSLYANISVNLGNFFRKRESQVKFIFIKCDDALEEIPFIDGIDVGIFTTILIEFKIIEKGTPVDKIIRDSLLKQVDRKIYLCSEDEILAMEETPAAVEVADDDNHEFDNLPEDAKKYFIDNRAKVKSIFIKSGDALNEVPFVDGMPVNIFSRMVRELKLVDKNTKFQKIILDNFLTVKNNSVYFASEEDLWSKAMLEELGIDIQKLSMPSREFLQTNVEKIRFVEFSRAGVKYKVPFVNGMNLSVFARILHELKVLGKSASTQSVLTSNGFTITGNEIFHK